METDHKHANKFCMKNFLLTITNIVAERTVRCILVEIGSLQVQISRINGLGNCRLVNTINLQFLPASYAMGTGGSFPGGKARPGRDADHSPPSSAEVNNE
jgi:hypothetical protein